MYNMFSSQYNTNLAPIPWTSIFKSDMSDHFFIFCSAKTTLSANFNKTTIYKRKFRDGTMDWNYILNNDTNKSYEKYTMLPFQKRELN